MPPDADKLRQRHTTQVQVASSLTTSATTRSIATVDDLSSTEICIDGKVYDISTFDHPGGDSIGIFGGNDVTVQYKMIHPYHTSKHLEKIRLVGQINEYHSEYKFDTPFEREIKAEVFKIVHRGQEFATLGYWFRLVLYIALYAYLQYLWIAKGSSWSLAIVYGVAQAAIGTNVQHDANHGAISKRYPFLNDLFGFGADFIGGSKWLWMLQHWTHHAYTNHATKDADSFSAEPMMLFNDYPLSHPARKWYHNLQAFYYLFVLAGYWVSSVFNPQVIDLKQRGALSIGMHMESDYLRHSRKYAIALRLWYIYVHVVCPIQYHGFGARAIIDIILLGVSESLALSVLFSLSHNFENADRDPTHETKLDADGKVCWFKSQVETSSTYGGRIAGYLTGGLNFQIEHHLFPRMSSAWYPYIAPTVRRVCEKHGVRYTYYPWVWQNLWSTIRYMHAAGTGANWRSDQNPYSGKL